MKRKIFFFDMDGTLLPHGVNQTISENNLYALNKLEELGYHVVLNTGKSYSMCFDQLKLYNFKTAITSNGQNIIHNNEIIYSGCFENEDITYWIEYAKINNLQIGFQTDNKQYILNSNEADKYRRICFEHLNVDLPIIIDKLANNINVQQIWLLGNVGNLSLRDDFDYFRWHDYACDVQLKGINKGSGALRVIEHLGYQDAEIYAFGDGENDLSMFKISDVSVAMNDASDFVKANASNITTSASEDGVYNFLKLDEII